jgi:CelD/BcsL family acetyltransferase involved in cellulose biosynthesis
MDISKIDWQVKPVATFLELSEEWDLLNRKLNGPLVLSSQFIDALLSEFSSNDEQIILGRYDGKLVFAAIFEQLQPKRWRTFQASQAPLGCVLCSDSMLTQSLVKLVADLLPNKPMLLDFTQLDSAQYSKEHKTTFDYSTYITTGCLDVPHDFDEYFAQFSKNTRQNFNKSRNRLKREGVETKFSIVSCKDEVASAIAQYGVIESAGWKNEQGTAVSLESDQGRFYIKLLENFAKSEQCQIWLYYFNEAVVAVDLCITNNDTIIILKTTYDESYAKYSQSLLMKLND